MNNLTLAIVSIPLTHLAVPVDCLFVAPVIPENAGRMSRFMTFLRLETAFVLVPCTPGKSVLYRWVVFLLLRLTRQAYQDKANL